MACLIIYYITKDLEKKPKHQWKLIFNWYLLVLMDLLPDKNMKNDDGRKMQMVNTCLFSFIRKKDDKQETFSTRHIFN